MKEEIMLSIKIQFLDRARALNFQLFRILLVWNVFRIRFHAHACTSAHAGAHELFDLDPSHLEVPNLALWLLYLECKSHLVGIDLSSWSASSIVELWNYRDICLSTICMRFSDI